MSKRNNTFFLFSFLPVVGYWLLDEYYPVRVAVIGGIILSILEICFEKFFTKEVSKISYYNFFLITVLGGLSLFEDDGVWFKLQPGLSTLAIFGLMIVQRVRGKSVMLDMMRGKQGNEVKLPTEVVMRLERDFIVFMGLFSVLLVVAALYFSTGVWVFLKSTGIIIGMVLFLIYQVGYSKIKARQVPKTQ